MIPTKDRIYLVIIATLIIIILFIKSCAQHCPEVEVISKVDTVWKHSRDTLNTYTPGVDRYFPVAVEIVRTDSLIEYEYIKPDTAAILKDYYATRFYSDTIRSKDKNASVVINDSVSRNMITSRSPVFDISIPVITNTVTTIIKEEPRTQVYFGITGMGNKNSVYAGGSLLLKTKKELMIEAGALYGSDNRLMYQWGLKVPIRLRKR